MRLRNLLSLGLLLPLGTLPRISAAADASVAAADASKPMIVVVCPAEFRPAMQPWLARREQQQNRVEFVSNQGSADEIRGRICELAKTRKPRAVVVVGDAPPKIPEPKPSEPPATNSQQTPTFYIPAKVNKYWGGHSEFASDNPYADFDGDCVPDVAIGRLPADSAVELSGMIQKILAYEDNRNFGPWRSQINLVAGEGGFGVVVDGIIESAARRFITWGVPAPYRTTMTYASWQSPYCPDPHRLQACCLERLNEGCLFWVYVGHGSPERVKSADFPDGRQPILSCRDCTGLNCGDTPAIAMFLACSTGAFAGNKDCLAEDLLRSPGGPVAVISGSDVTMPYAMSALGREAMRECFENRRETVGDMLLYAKRSMSSGYGLPLWSLTNALIEAIAPESFHPKAERHEHLQLFHLFGDPTMKLPAPKVVELIVPDNATAGQNLHIRGESPIAGEVLIELVVRRDRLRDETPARSRYDAGKKGRDEFEATYRAANDPCLAKVTQEIAQGKFEADLTVPADATGPCHVRVFITGKGDYALGASDVSILTK